MGRVIMSGIVPLLKAPVTGILAQDIAVGSTVKLMEGGAAVEYLVVNQGIPSNSNLYDASCDGTWLLRKNIYSKRPWNSVRMSEYAKSDINTWLNGTFFNSLGSVEQASIKQVKIPYSVDYHGNIASGANGLPVKVFLLSGYELGWSNVTYMPIDGAKLDYFVDGTSDEAKEKRKAYLNGVQESWWMRTIQTQMSGDIWFTYDGNNGYGYSTETVGIRPALLLPSNALFDKTTMLLKGVK